MKLHNIIHVDVKDRSDVELLEKRPLVSSLEHIQYLNFRFVAYQRKAFSHWSKWTLIPFLIWRTFDHSRRWEMINMAIRVVEFSNGGYKIRKIFA